MTVAEDARIDEYPPVCPDPLGSPKPPAVVFEAPVVFKEEGDEEEEEEANELVQLGTTLKCPPCFPKTEARGVNLGSANRDWAR